MIPITITKRRAFLFYCALTALLFGRSLSYEFVYDDDWRIYRNPAVQQLLPLSAYFLNPETQSGRSLEGHTYRPLSTFIFALTHATAGMKASWYRLQNLLVHSLNATFIFIVGIQILELSSGAALLAGAFFLIHPLQVETVVWVSELSNALVLTWILCGALAWQRYRYTGRAQFATATFIFGLLGFLTRENSVCLFPLLLALEAIPTNQQATSPKQRIALLLFLLFFTLLYIGARAHLLGRVAQGPLWGSTIATHVANIVQIWPLYWERLLWPDDLRIIYSSLPILSSVWHWRALIGLFGFGFYLLLTILAWKQNRRWGFALTAFVIFWIPGANIIPLNTLFAERLMYPLVACAGWWLGLGLQATRSRRAWAAALLGLGLLAFVTERQIPVWRNEDTLWAQAVNIEPDSWFAWGCLGNANELIADNQADPKQKEFFLKRANACYLVALEKNPLPERKPMILERLDVIKDELKKSDNDTRAG